MYYTAVHDTVKEIAKSIPLEESTEDLHYARRHPQSLARYFNVSAQTEWQTALRYTIAPSQEVAVIRVTGDGRALTTMRWGLIPCWATDP